eukprot:748158-Hanusia_phi.AAC.3
MILLAASFCVEDKNLDMFAQAATWLSASVSEQDLSCCRTCTPCCLAVMWWSMLARQADDVRSPAVSLRRLDVRICWGIHHSDPQEHAASCATSAGVSSVCLLLLFPLPVPLTFLVLLFLPHSCARAIGPSLSSSTLAVNLLVSSLTCAHSPLLYDD